MPNWNLLIVAVSLAVAWLAPGLGERWFRPVEAAFSKIAARRKTVIALVFFGTIALRLALLPVIPVPVPGIHDEFSYLLAADTFAHGRLANPPHPLWVSFETFHVNWFPTYSSIYPPAQGLVLAVGQLLGHPWIGVLLSDAAMCAVILWMLQAWFPARWALLGGAITVLKLGIISYWMNSYWGGAVAAAGGALVLGALPRIFRSLRIRDALLLGLGLAILANSRPYEGLVLSVPAAGAFLYWLLGPSSPQLIVKIRRAVLPLTVLLILTAAFIGFYNWRLTGNALLMPHVLNTRTYHSTGQFIWEKMKPPLAYRNHQFEVFYNTWSRNHYRGTSEDVLRITWEKARLYSETYLWLGALPLLLCLPLLFRDRRVRLLLLELFLFALGLLPVVWYFPHYAAPALCVFYALLVQTLRHVRTFRFMGRPVGVGLSRMMILLLLVTVGAGLYQRIRDPYQWGWNGSTGNWQRAAVAEKLRSMPGKQLAIVRYGRFHSVHEEWVYNAADIDGSKVVWARELDAEQNRKLLGYYRDRRVWLVQPENRDTR